MPTTPGPGNAVKNSPLSGTSETSAGVSGQSNTGPGVSGQSIGLIPPTLGPGTPVGLERPASDGVLGQGANGVHGISTIKTTATTGAGVWGENESGDGVVGTGYHGVHGISASAGGAGVWGESTATGAGSAGVSGTSTNSNGVFGQSQSNKFAGVYGINNSASGGSGGFGVYGSSSGTDGVHGESQSPKNAGVSGINASGGYGVWGSSSRNDGVHGECQSAQHAGVYGTNTGGGPAGYFKGDVQVTGDVVLINSSGDVAEDFDVEEDLACEEPGTVLVISPSGRLCRSVVPYDSRVAGVVAGAGDLKPAIVLQRMETYQRSPIALIGKTFCKVDASFGSIKAGDLLTTSSTPGHAMKAVDFTRATGAILGKALRHLENGQGLIPILVTPH